MFNSDQKSSISSSISSSRGPSGPNRNVASSSAAQPWRRESAAGDEKRVSPVYRTPQLDDPDIDLLEYEEDDPIDAHILAAANAAVSDLAVSSSGPDISISQPLLAPIIDLAFPELKESKEREEKILPASFNQNQQQQQRQPPAPAPAPFAICSYQPYGYNQQNLTPSHYTDCSICFQKRFSNSTGSKCNTRNCATKICIQCTMKLGSDITCPFCKQESLRDIAVLPTSSIDAGIVNDIRAEQVSLVAQLKAAGIPPQHIVKVGIKQKLDKFRAQVQQAQTWQHENPNDFRGPQFVAQAELALGKAEAHLLPKLDLLTKYLENDKLITKLEKVATQEQKIHEKLVDRNARAARVERQASSRFDYASLLAPASQVPPPKPKQPRQYQQQYPQQYQQFQYQPQYQQQYPQQYRQQPLLVNGDGFSGSVYVGNGQS